MHYSPWHNLHDEWVNNLADIDGSKVLWARDMGPDRNSELIKYFSDRTVWLVKPEEEAGSKNNSLRPPRANR